MSAWFELDDFEDDRQRSFLLALETQYERWRLMGLDENHIWALEAEGILTIAIDISDRSCNLALRSLRADFGGNEVIVGKDPTGQLDGKLEKDSESTRTLTTPGNDPVKLAALTVSWLEEEFTRNIERHEWNASEFQHKRWILADTGEVLCWSDSQNIARKGLGKPDRIVEVGISHLNAHK